MAFDDDPILECEITVTNPETGETFTVEFPCGSVFDTRVSPVDSSNKTQVPFRYQVLKERSFLKPCCWWRDSDSLEDDMDPSDYDGPDKILPEVFSFVVTSGQASDIETLGDMGETVVGGWAHEDSPSFYVKPGSPYDYETVIISGSSVPTKCTHSGAAEWNQGNDRTPPCNGAKTECPFYTGPEFKYINDEDLRQGKTITGQQIQELRSLLRDWTVISGADELWEQVFEDPFIWARDIDDQPLILPNPTLPEQIVESETKISNLVQVKWKTASEDVELTVYPSTPGDPNAEEEDTPMENVDGTVTPPKYYTLVQNLTNNRRPPLEISFPPPVSRDGLLSEEGFKFDSMTSFNNRMYIAGTTYSFLNVYIINTSIITGFPLRPGQDPSDEEISDAMDIVFDEVGAFGDVSGFKTVYSDASRFWELQDGIELIPNQTNSIAVLVRVNNEWNYTFFDIHYGFHYMELYQDGFKGLLTTPQTQSLSTSWANMNNTEPVEFKGITVGGTPTISNVYHYYVFDRSLRRLISTRPENFPDRRYWKVTKRTETLEGTGETTGYGDLRWSKFDNCNTFLIEITGTKVPAAKPAGLDRGWEPRNITLKAQPERASGHGERQEVDVEMEVLEGSDEVGRSIDGSLFPSRFLIVRPVNGHSISTPSKDSVMEVELDIFEAMDIDDEGTDIFEELYEEFPETISGTAGGIQFYGIGEQVVLADQSVHTVSTTESNVSISANKYDMSYMVEFAGPDGDVLGRKWIYGVGEVCSTWVRDVDIRYAWSSIESSQVLTPDYARATAQLNKPSKVFDPGDPRSTAGQLTTFVPQCGDHEGHWLFSPYSQCTSSRIEVNDGGILISQDIETDLVQDERYRGPERQLPFSEGHNPAGVLTPCVFEWTFGTKTRVEPTWAGLARLRGPITEFMDPFLYSKYVLEQWAFPQFGNKGREHIRIFRSMHFREYIYNSSSGPKVSAGWMPVVPFIGSTGIFDETKPRTIFDYAVESSTLSGIDYNSQDGQRQLELMAVEDENSITSANLEIVSPLRFSYEQAFEVSRPGKIGDGIQWPPNGWYLNPKNPNFLWAFPEPIVDISRDTSGSGVLTGILVSKPTPDTSALIYDRFDRPVDVGPLEGEVEFQFTPTKYDDDGQVIEYATVHVDENFPTYFDMLSGEIKDTDYSGNPAIYSGLTPSGIAEELAEFGITAEIVPLYTPINNAELEGLPEGLTDLNSVSFYGNVATDMSKCYVYATNGSAGNSLDDEEIIWNGFFRTAEITSIAVDSLPWSEFPIKDADGVQGSTAEFSNYPTINQSTRDVFNGRKLGAFTSGMLGPADTLAFTWKPYSTDDLELEDPSQGEGSIGPISNTVTFSNTMKITSIAVSYEVFPRETGTVLSKPIAGPNTDPQVVLKLVGDVEELTLLEKPRIRLGGTGDRLRRDFTFDGEDFDPFKTNSIVLEVGARDSTTGIEISGFEVKIAQPVPEDEIMRTLNPKVFLSTGYGTDVDVGTYLPAQHDYLTATVTTPDQADRLEVSNIAEFWQPGAVSLDSENVVGTKGKIRRHWANGFKTYDTNKYFGQEGSDNTVFADAEVLISERRQQDLIDEFYNTVSELPSFLKDELKYFLLPYDQYLLSQGLFRNRLEGKSIKFEVEGDWSDLEVVSETSLPPGWQPNGFYACIPDQEQVIVSCVVNLGVLGFGPGSRTAHSVYKSESHDTCSADFQGGRSAYSLFEFGRITEKLIGTLHSSTAGLAGAPSSGELDSVTDLFENQTATDRLAAATQEKIEEQLNNLGRYRP
jgi:hypothetical protein